MHSVLDKAKEIVTERQVHYGTPLENHKTIADVWTALLKASKVIDGDVSIKPEEVALMMIAVKLCREFNAHKMDNLVDIAGYLLVAEECIDCAL